MDWGKTVVGGLLLISLAVLASVASDTREGRDYYHSLWEMEQETTQLLMQNTLNRIRDKVSFGTDVINIEIPCTVDNGVVHQVHYRVVR